MDSNMLERSCTDIFPHDESVVVVEVKDELEIRADLDDVFNAFWNPSLWEQVTPHVRGVCIDDQTENYQKLRMTIVNEEQTHHVETERFAIKNKEISYKQTKPPKILEWHEGLWKFSVRQDVIVVTLEHRAGIKQGNFQNLLKVSREEGKALVASHLKRSGQLTMCAIKSYLENRI